MVVDAGPLVLALVDADAEAEDEAPAGEQLEGGGLLGHDGGLAQGQLEHAGPQQGPAGRRGGHRQRRQRLADGVGPVEVVHRPQGVGPGGLGPAAQLSDLARALPVVLWVLPSLTSEFSLRGGGEDEPEGRARRSTSYRGHTDILRRWPRP